MAAAARKLSLAWKNISKTLKLRAVIFDARSLQRSAAEAAASAEADKKRQAWSRRSSPLQAAGIGSAALDIRDPDKLIAAGNVKAMLQKEIREALRDRGQDAVGKPWELKARLEALLVAERHESGFKDAAQDGGGGEAPNASSAAADGSASSPASTSSPASASSPASVRAKYADKLRQRAGISMTSSGGLASTTDRRVPMTPDDQRPANAWHFQPGCKALFTYIDMRGMLRGLLPSEDRETEDDAAQQAAQLSKSLQTPDFAHVLGLREGIAARAAERSAFDGVCAALELPSQAVMVVSDDEAVLRGARLAGSFACHLIKQAPGAPQRLRADFHATDCDGIKDAIEELNGITFRDPETEIRSKYGVYAT